MKKVIYLVGIFVLSSAIMAVSIPRKYTIYNDWSNIQLVDTLVAGQLSDTLLAFCTNRGFSDGQKEFLNYAVNDDSLQYLVATFKKGKWWVDRVSGLESAVYYFSERDYVVYVEGMGKTFPLNLRRASALSAQYSVNVIMFDYPSIHPEKSMTGNFYFAYKNARESGISFGKFLEEFSNWKVRNSTQLSTARFTLFHHSMGNRMLKAMVEEGAHKFSGRMLFDNVVLNAACVPQRKHKEWVEKIDFAERIFINYNRKDFQLNGAMIITFDKMLGARLRKPFAENATYVDFHPLVDKSHSNFLNIKEREDIPARAREFYNSILHGEEADLNDLDKFDVTKDKTAYVLKATVDGEL